MSTATGYSRASCVKSRLLVWCLSGAGRIRVNGRAHDVGPDRFLFLPWGCSVAYLPQPHVSSLRLGGVHIIPDHAPDQPLESGVSHGPGDRLAACPWRRDAPGLPRDVVSGMLTNRPAVRHMAEAAVALWQEDRLDRPVSASLAQMLLSQLRLPVAQRRLPHPALPHRLHAVVVFTRDHLQHRLTLTELSRVAGCSCSTLNRMFRRQFGLSPIEWVIRERMQSAAQQLLSSGATIAEIAANVGIDNPFYFSRLFRKVMGCPPREYRSQRMLI